MTKTGKELFYRPFGEWIEGDLDKSESRSALSIARVRNRLIRLQLPLPPGAKESDARRQVVSFDNATLDVRINDWHINPSLATRRVVASLSPAVVESVWADLFKSRVIRELPQKLSPGVTVIVATSMEEDGVAKAAITTPEVPETHHPEHEYVHVNPGTLVKAQLAYPLKDRINIYTKSDFYDELIASDTTVDDLMSGVVGMVGDLLGRARDVASLGVVSIEPITAISFIEV